MSSISLWVKVALAAWIGSIAIVLLSEVGWLQRLIPDWLRNLSRILVVVGTVVVLTSTVLFGVNTMIDAWQSRPQVSGGPKLDISLESPQALYTSLYLSTNQEKLNQAASDDPTEVNFVVELGETATMVAARLEEEGLVIDGEVFRRFMTYHGLDVSLEAGRYTLQADMTMHEIAEELQHGGTSAVTVTIPEGWRMEQVAWLLEQNDLVRADDFLAQATAAEYAYSWLEDRPPGVSLEGFLFPDTYELPIDVTPDYIVDLMVAVFDTRAAQDLAAGLPGKQIFDLALGDYRPLTAYDILTLASIVEREAVIAEERPIIASVYYNRLDPAYVEETALRLSSDPTIQYAKGVDPETGIWWNPMLPGEGQIVESPYNTFKVQGLPPSPICSPGLASIQAVLNPADTDFLYFHAVGDGTHVFASTLEEHLANQEKYTTP